MVVSWVKNPTIGTCREIHQDGTISAVWILRLDNMDDSPKSVFEEFFCTDEDATSEISYTQTNRLFRVIVHLVQTIDQKR